MSAFSDFLDSGPPPVEQEPLPQTSPLVMDQSPDIIGAITERTVAPDRDPHPMEGRTATKYGEDFNRALAVSPRMRAHWTPEIEHKTENSFARAVWESAKRDSFIGNTTRWMDQVIQEGMRTQEDEDLIWGAREELTHNISAEYHDAILDAPTFGLALREADRVRHREEQIRREHHQSVGKTLAADLAGFIIDPTNLLPGYGMLKGVSVARRMSAISTLKGVAASSKGRQMAALATAGAFEEAIRMAPRYASDPTYETNNYMEGIAMSAAFSGLMPLAFRGFSSGIGRLPDLSNDINMSLHSWGADVGVRQAMRFPGEFKKTGFRDPGTALRKSKELAQDNVNRKVKELNKTAERRKVNEALKGDLAGENPSNSKLMEWMDRKFDQAGDIAIERLRVKAKRHAVATGATAAATVAGGPVAGLTTAVLFANRDYLAVAAKLAIRRRNLRRVAYDTAITNGDQKAAAQILRDARTKATLAETVDDLSAMITESVDKAKAKIKDINTKARVCT